MNADNEKIIDIQFDNAPQTIDIDFGNVQQITVGNVSVRLEETDEGVEITAWDAQGEETALVRHGKPGENGFSPVVEVGTINGGHRVTVTDRQGTQSFDVINGRDGQDGVYFETDETLTLENGILSVNTADEVEKDNTLPVTSAAVYTEVGNINALLATI